MALIKQGKVQSGKKYQLPCHTGLSLLDKYLYHGYPKKEKFHQTQPDTAFCAVWCTSEQLEAFAWRYYISPPILEQQLVCCSSKFP